LVYSSLAHRFLQHKKISFELNNKKPVSVTRALIFKRSANVQTDKYTMAGVLFFCFRGADHVPVSELKQRIKNASDTIYVVNFWAT
jgi:thiol-disulfide isomerase/thioredoxin